MEWRTHCHAIGRAKTSIEMGITRHIVRYFGLIAAITVSLVAVILCYLARTIGVNSDPQVLSITADYRWLGWTLRIVAAILAAVALLILFLDRQGTRRSFVPRNLARLGIGLAIAALFWEIAVPAATIAFLVLGIWAFFTGPGDAGELGDLDFDIVD